MNDDMKPRVCKKCGTELPSDYKYNKCDSCRRKKAKIIREGLMFLAGLCGTVLAVWANSDGNGPFGDNDDEEEDDDYS